VKNYLLDTHAFLWVIFKSKKFSKKANEIIFKSFNIIYNAPKKVFDVFFIIAISIDMGDKFFLIVSKIVCK
jgi:hypothetical protein